MLFLSYMYRGPHGRIVIWLNVFTLLKYCKIINNNNNNNKIIGFIKIMCFPAISAFLRLHTFMVLSLLKRERSTSNYMRKINKGNI